MKRIAITGQARAGAVRDALRATVQPYAAGGIVGITCLVDDVDRVFADVVVELGGRLEAVIVGEPPSAEALARYDSVRRISGCRLEACLVMLADADLLVAVWDGAPGHAADVVQHARQSGLPVAVLWPGDVTRRWPVRQAAGPVDERPVH